MLTADHSIVRYENGQAIPDRLTRITHKHYLAYAERMLAAYESGVGRTRRELHRAVENVLGSEPDCDRRRIGSFCKLLDDAGEFATDRRGEAAALRLKVFAVAAAHHPLVVEPDKIFERSEREVKERIAIDLGRTWDEIDSGLYVDVLDRQPLVAFEPLEPQALLSRYNLEQLQACLYKARSMVVEASADFALIVRSAKLARLLVESRRVSDREHRIELSGPASVLHETRRYGISFARFVAALVRCRSWRMRARVITPWGASADVRVSSEDGYRSHLPPPAPFDSAVEAALAKKWGESRHGWRLSRDATILQAGQATFVPDFLLRHDDGREVFLEIVGFWTPEYLAAKRRTLMSLRTPRMLLAVPTRTARPDVSTNGLIVYKTRIDPEAVGKAAEALNRESDSGA